MLDAKRLESKLASDASIFNRLLEKEGEECSLKCPSCEGLMYEFKIVYVVPEGGGGGSLGNIGGGGGGGGAIVAIIVVVLVIAVVSAAMNESKKKSGGEGSVMAIDGCKDCGVFWFDGDELRIVKSAEGIRGADEVLDARRKKKKPGTVANPDWKGATETNLAKTTSARITNCLHVDEKNGKNCRRVTYRGTEYCYMHQPK
tara:strand:- start:3288 stop:3890 length:603 start_codon:yes stop_codon:yes gene_type:complete